MDIAQEKMVQNMQYMNPKELIAELYKVFDKCFHIYMQEKEVRQTLSKNNIIQEELVDVLAQNRNIATNIIEAINIWLENTVLFQENINKKYRCHKKNIDPSLFVDLYIPKPKPHPYPRNKFHPSLYKYGFVRTSCF